MSATALRRGTTAPRRAGSRRAARSIPPSRLRSGGIRAAACCAPARPERRETARSLSECRAGSPVERRAPPRMPHVVEHDEAAGTSRRPRSRSACSGSSRTGAAPTLAACWLHSAVVAQGSWPVSAALAIPGMQAIESIRAVIFDFIWVSSFPVPGAIEVRTETGADCSFCLGGTASRGQSDRRRSF